MGSKLVFCLSRNNVNIGNEIYGGRMSVLVVCILLMKVGNNRRRLECDIYLSYFL